ncbi:MAG: hypothetical protein COA49_09465 [Bacteroidetes bacterium]|nr:MAG: hypothetical protein COA49_09465 [Bacteroidota bacterium]
MPVINTLRAFSCLLFISFVGLNLSTLSAQNTLIRTSPPSRICLGNENIEAILNLTAEKRVAIVGNHTSVLYADIERYPIHLVDTLLSSKVDIVKVFAPEHGFRGDHANGDHITDDVDPKTGLPILSLHGKFRKPSPESLSDLDIIIFDIQDVGARFYTYLSTLLLVMEAAAENDIDVIVLDRPNPHGHHVAGPMLDPAFKSFVGWAPVPVIHGMTFGEIALMANAEGWLENSVTTGLYVIPCDGYYHSDRYALPIAPSPNLPTKISIELYPSLCFLEPTNVSIGRGTPTPFEIAGIPSKLIYNNPRHLSTPYDKISFTPVPTPIAAPHPKHENVLCIGENFKTTGLQWWKEGPSWDISILEGYANSFRNENLELTGFFTSKSFFDKLAGTDKLRLCLEEGEGLDELKKVWAKEIIKFKKSRSPYLLYPSQRKL